VSILGMILGWILGAGVTVSVPVVAGLPPPVSWLGTGPTLVAALIVLFVAIVVLYLFVSLATTSGQPSTMNPFGEFCLGALIGINAGANFMLLFAALFVLFGPFGLAIAPVAATVLSGINALAAVPQLASAPRFAAILGWSSWAMPMSWPMTGLGVVFFFANMFAIPAGVLYRPWCEWWTGTVILHGGWIYAGRNGFNLGNFSFFHPDFADSSPWFDPGQGLVSPHSVQALAFHETGHTLNVAACGSLFHVIGFFDQNVLTGAFAYAEQLSEGHLHDLAGPWVDWWRPQIAAIGSAPNVLPTTTNPAIVAPAVIALGGSITLDRTDAAIVPLPPTDGDSYPQGSINPGVIPSIGFLWTVGSAPPGSTATLATPTATTTTLTPDIGGTYVVRLHYSDGLNGSPATITSTGPLSPAPIVAPVTPPIDSDAITVVEARTIAVLSGPANTNIALSSAGSVGLDFLWVISEQPAGSTATIDQPAQQSPNFRADTAGSYVVTLTVSFAGVSHQATTRVDVT
jgi:hypothetical protein